MEKGKHIRRRQVTGALIRGQVGNNKQNIKSCVLLRLETNCQIAPTLVGSVAPERETAKIACLCHQESH